jgi:electron transport complex protein RnfG
MKYYLKLGFVLFMIAAIASGILAYINGITLPKIQESEKQAQDFARKNVLPNASFFEKDSLEVKLKKDNNPLKIQQESDTAWFEFYRGYDDSKNLVGYTFQAAKYGYSSEVRTMVGLSNDMKINKIEIVSQAETPGLGAKCTEPGFAEKYTGLGKEQLLVDKDGGTIKSITGATISTRAITESIKSAVEILSANIAPSAQGGKDE